MVSWVGDFGSPLVIFSVSCTTYEWNEIRVDNRFIRSIVHPPTPAVKSRVCLNQDVPKVYIIVKKFTMFLRVLLLYGVLLFR